MWESPIYKFNQEVGKDEYGNVLYKQVVIDVTSSAPSFDSPRDVLGGALDEALEYTEVGPNDGILDVGAGKLRNTVYLLEKGYRVCAVEFAKQFKKKRRRADRRDVAHELRTRAEQEFDDRFKKLVYPHDFQAATPPFKLILLINVINVMPVPAERDYLLALCNERIAADGRLFWYTQRGDKHYKERKSDESIQFGDGIYVGRRTYYKTFYREFEVGEIDDMLRLAGFDYDRSINAGWYNQCRLYRKIGPAVLSDVLDPAAIDRAQVSDDKIPEPKRVKAKRKPEEDEEERFKPKLVTSSGHKRKGNPVAARLSHRAKLVEALGELPHDLGRAKSYEEKIRAIVEILFDDKLRNFRFEASQALPEYRDVVADNPGDGGFFAALKREYRLKVPRVHFECRNLPHRLEEPAFQQLGVGLPKPGFGFLAHRGGVRSALIKRCQRVFRAFRKVIVPLQDSDFATLLELRASGNGEAPIDAFLAERLHEVMTPGKVFVSYSHKDRRFHDELRMQLKPLVRSGIVARWDDTLLKAGDIWNELIREAVATAEVAVLLVSPDFLASDYIVDKELEPLLNPPARRKLTLVPVMVRPTAPDDLEIVGLNRRQFVNFDDPLHGRRQDMRDRIWIEVKKAIRQGLA